MDKQTTGLRTLNVIRARKWHIKGGTSLVFGLNKEHAKGSKPFYMVAKELSMENFKGNIPDPIDRKPNVALLFPVKEEPPLDLNEDVEFEMNRNDLHFHKPGVLTSNLIKEELSSELYKALKNVIDNSTENVIDNSTENINCLSTFIDNAPDISSKSICYQPKVIDDFQNKEEFYDDLLLKYIPMEEVARNTQFNQEIGSNNNPTKTGEPLGANDGNCYLKPEVCSKETDVLITKDRGHDSTLDETEPKRIHDIVINQQAYWKCIEECRCPYCQYSGQSKSELFKHLTKRHKKESPFKCSICSFSVTNFKSSWKHQRDSHLIYQCPICNFITNSNSKLYCHRKIHQPKQFQCPSCSYKCHRKCNLIRHIEAIHMKSMRFKCNVCNFRFAYSESLRFHIEAEHSPNIKCDLCKYTAKTKKCMKVHVMEVHLKERIYSCPLCNYRSSRRTSFRSHHKTIHLNIKPSKRNKDFVCYHCSKSFNAKCLLKSHILVKHFNIKPFKCAMCKNKFTTNLGKKMHIAVKHSVTKKYSCKECDYQAGRKDYLDKHVISCHTNNKPFECPYCNHSSARRDNIKAHIKRVHQE